ncbi:MAG: UDP-N-acetylmuramoyl-tripeptide--D-alanyl-D-alanine ligase, partial [Acidobacteriaceae bacterium]|nr:UDP-N-acetylmuramoyl-tripeptide--D-alanyl-D-alanine ligase [Acidobacteriaceae bacterium]
MELSLAQIEQATGAQFISAGRAAAPRDTLRATRITGWSIDSRSVQPGELFFAIPGEHLDGHAYIQNALNAGAVAAIVSQNVNVSGGAILRVDNSVRALTQVAEFARRNWGRPVLAITGSAGKTSTKEIIAALLSTRFLVGKTTGNLNNHLGLPLTLLRISDQAEIAVVEIGMNHAGEIRELARIARPQVGVVTNVGYAHIEAFDSIEEIAAAKRE